jgi:glycosyltransferase involved in cell wall biosynthesis
MRILQVSTSDHGGGAEGSAWNLFQAYRQRGHVSWLAVGQKNSDDSDVFPIPNEECRPAWTRFWQRVHNQLSATRLANLSRPAVALARLPQAWQFIETKLGRENFNFPGTYHLLQLPPQRPDIVHCHNLHGNYFDLRALPWLSRQVPVILNLRDAWLLSGHCACFFDCERWKFGCGKCKDLMIYPSVKRDATAYNWRRKRNIYMNSHLYITTVSHWLLHSVQESMLRGTEYKVIPNGIDLSIFHPGDRHAARRELGLSLTSRIVLYAANGGSKSPWRNFHQLEAAMQELAVSSAEELVLICLGQRNIEQNRVSGNLQIQHLGFERDPRRMALYYQAVDIYVLPALAEAFGKTIIEAMACGTPVVATTVGGIPEQIIDGETGFLVPQSDVTAMATAIQRLFADVGLRQRMGNAAAEYARRFFGLDRQVNSFLSWYEDVQHDWLEWKRHEES